jgi:hypothetical protein
MFNSNKQQNQKKITFVMQKSKQKLDLEKDSFFKIRFFFNSFILRFIFTTSSIERRRRRTIDYKERQKKDGK